MTIEWNTSLSVGIKELDDQHKTLFKQINQLIDACHLNKGPEVIGQVLDFLDDYARGHFQTEEAYMRRYEYPGLEGHRQQHQEFMENLAQVRRRFSQEGAGVHIVVITNRLLAGGLNSHIRRSDKALGKYISEIG